MNEIKISCCRICRESTSSDEVTFEFDTEWSRLYEFCFGLQVTAYGPQKICKSCIDKLNDYGNFKQLCLQSEEMWKSLSNNVICSLDKLNIVKEESNDYVYEFDYKQDHDYISISDEELPLTHLKDEKIYEFVNNDNDNLGEDCVDEIKKPPDKDGDEAFPIKHEDKDVKINEFVNNLKNKLGEICIDKIKKPLDKDEDEIFLIAHEDKHEKANEFVSSLKEKLGEICINKIKKPLDKDTQMSILDNNCRNRKTNSSADTNHSKRSEKNNEIVNKLKDKAEVICIDKIKKPLDKDTQFSIIDNIKRNIKSNTDTKHSKYADKKGKLKITKEKNLLKTSKSRGSSKCDVNTKQAATEFYCGICEYKSTTSSEVDQHFVKHCEDNDLKCKLCSFEGKDVADMALHRYTHNNQKDQNKISYKCPLCNKKFKLDENLRIHYRSEHLKLKYDCQFCGKSLNYKQLKMHEKLHVSPKFKCDHCVLGFLSRSALRNHMFTHQVENPFVCEQCGKGFKSINNLKKHIIYKHTKTKPEICKVCNRQFKNIVALDCHIRVKHAEKKFFCDSCDMGFGAKGLLKHHIFIRHSDERPYACDRCDSTYRSLKMLKAHKRSKHSGELPYKCANCGKRFSCNARCKRHQVSGCQIP